MLLRCFIIGQDIACSDETEYYQNGYIEFCILAREDTLSGQSFPAGTGVHFSENGVFDWCFLQQDTSQSNGMLPTTLVSLYPLECTST